MTAPNRNTLWARAIVDELVKSGIEAVCIAPGSRSTPLTVAFADRDDVTIFSHLDERSAAFFALGRAKRTGTPTPVLTTSGTATANLHPAVMEADNARVPLLVLTADRPPELRDTGANQTADQEKLYGTAVRFYHDLPEPEADDRKLRSLRTRICRAVAATTGSNPGPAHLNVPFRKPLEPVEVPGDVPDGFGDEYPEAALGRDGPFVAVHEGTGTPDPADVDRIASVVEAASTGLIVAGPDDAFGLSQDAAAALSSATGFPIIADPLSNLRWGPHNDDVPVLGGYDAYLDADLDVSDPAVVLRFGASPTSKVLRHFLRDTADRQFVVDPAGDAGGWREAAFTATHLVVADPDTLATHLAESLPVSDEPTTSPLQAVEDNYWSLVADEPRPFEGRILSTVVRDAPDPATVFVSNSMPVRDLDRFGEPSTRDLTVLGNRGVSGIDGVTSTALGAGSATDDPLVLVTGDIAYYHDMNGLLALDRCDVDATIVLVNNDGGGIFHMLPIEDHDPPFTSQFKTPHGLDFEPTSDLYGFDYARVDPPEFPDAYREALDRDGTNLVEVTIDAAESHRVREDLHERVCEHLGR